MSKTLKKTLAILVAILMIVTSVPMAFAASDVVASGECGVNGDNLTWTFDSDGVLTVSGTGVMADYDNVFWPQAGSYLPPWNDYKKDIKKIVIEDGVTKLGLYAFYECIAAKEISFPDSLTSTGGRSFHGCSSLIEVVIPEGLKIKGTDFQDCSSLKRVVFLGRANFDDPYHFNGCVELEEIVFAKGGTNTVDLPFGINNINNDEIIIHFGGTEAEAQLMFSPISQWDKFYSVAKIHYLNDCVCSDCGTYHIFENNTCNVCGLVCNFGEDYEIDEEFHWLECSDENCDVKSKSYHIFDNGACRVCEYACPHVSFINSICDNCGFECPHESIVEGKCDDCGIACPHKNVVDDKCDACGAEGKNITITMSDSYGDGWNGNAIVIEKLIDGVYTEVASATFENGGTATYNAFLDKDGNYVFKWIQGSFSNECSFVINVGGEDVYEVTGASGLTNGQVFCEICLHKTFTDGKCDYCDYVCTHETYTEGVCDECGYECDHAEQTGTCTICGMNLHTCDFTGEWKYDSEKHWKECADEDCDKTAEEAAHTWAGLYGVCAVCGYECPHESTQKDIFRPAQTEDGTWINGVLIATCDACGHSTVVQEVERDHEGYRIFDETAAKIEAILNSGVMVENMNEYYTRVLNNMKNTAYEKVYTDYEGAVPSMTESLDRILAEMEAGLADGTMKKADWTYMTAALEEIKALIDNNLSNIIPSMVGNYYSPNGFYSGSVNNPSYSQAAYDEAEANFGFRDQLETLIAGLKDGTALKADYTAIDEAIVKLDEKLADENLTDEAKAELEEIKADLEEMKADGNTSAADLAELEKALEEYETELDAGIEDGSAIKVDGLEEIVKINDALNNELTEKYGEEALAEIVEKIDEKFADKFDELYERAEALTGTVAENKEALAEIEAEMKAIFAEAEKCLSGAHIGLEYTVTEAAKCGVNAIESATCTLCGETVTREVENSALTHSFTKYEVTDEAKCGVEGKKVATCDNGCGETDEKAIAALEHIFLDYKSNNDATCEEDGTKTAECVFGCGTTETVTDEGTKLGHIDEDGDKICDECESEIKDVCPDCGGPVHEGEYGQYICALRILIKLLVSLIQLLATMA